MMLVAWFLRHMTRVMTNSSQCYVQHAQNEFMQDTQKLKSVFYQFR